ncbi:acetate kinase [Megalodesulfovibrio paquesii]
MKILVINSGSSSIKYQLFDMAAGNRVLCSGLVERIHEPMGLIKHKKFPDTAEEAVFTDELPIPDHKIGMQLVVDRITKGEAAVVASPDEIDGAGHRIVHGGVYFTEPVLVDDSVVEKLTATIPLAPLHNPGHLAGIATSRELLPKAKQVTVFDTAFHQTMAPEAYLYALPYEYYEELQVRRYGFHGTSHQYVFNKSAEFIGRKPEETSGITMHLGNGCSMDAVKRGKCIDTSMGLTPLAGLVMGTRCGDVDLAVYPYLAERKGLTVKEIDTVLNKQSGLKGICGVNDMRDVHARREAGDAKAQLAFIMFCRKVKHYIGAYLALLGECHTLSFTAGIGENDVDVRQEVCQGLEHLGIKIDAEKNATAKRGQPVDISADDSAVRILIMPTNEELAIAQQTLALLKTI